MVLLLLIGIVLLAICGALPWWAALIIILLILL